MGNNTTIVVLNDYAGEIKRSGTELQERLYQMLCHGETGEVIPGIKIIETHHADYTVDVRVGGNTASVVADSLMEPKRYKMGTWPENCLQRAFVEGAKWWEWCKTKATMWGSDVHLAETEAVKRYGEVRKHDKKLHR